MTLLHALRTVAIALLVGSAGGASSAQDAPQKLPAVPLSVGIFRISAEVARTPDERTVGLMFRKEMPENVGMLFIFESATQQCFWMKNTLIPLSIAFVADDGTIINLDRMKPQTLDPHCSVKPVRFVLEMNDGWFEKRGIKPGAKLRGSPFGT